MSECKNERKMTWGEVVEQWVKCRKERDELLAHVEKLVAALESIVEEDKNDTTYEENFGNALDIAKTALAEWRNNS